MFRRLKVADFDYKEACSIVAKKTEGLSAREITNLALDWQMSTYASLEGIFTKERMMERADAAIQHKKHKVIKYSFKIGFYFCHWKINSVFDCIRCTIYLINSFLLNAGIAFKTTLGII